MDVVYDLAVVDGHLAVAAFTGKGAMSLTLLQAHFASEPVQSSGYKKAEGTRVVAVVTFNPKDAPGVIGRILQGEGGLTKSAWDVVKRTLNGIRSVHGPAIPLLGDDRVEWMPLTSRTSEKTWSGLVAGALQEASSHEDVDLARHTAYEALTPNRKARLAGEVAQWGERVQLRRLLGVRLGFVLQPPSATDGTWVLRPVTIPLDRDAPQDVPLHGNARLPGDGKALPTTVPELEALEALLKKSARDVRTGEHQRRSDLVRLLLLEWRAVARSIRDLTGIPLEMDLDTVASRAERLSTTLQGLGVPLVLPDFWHRSTLHAEITVSGTSGTPLEPTLHLGANVTVENGSSLTLAEIQALETSGGRVVNVRGQWTRVDQKEVTRIRRLLERSQGQGLTPSEVLDLDLQDATIDVTGWVKDALKGDWTPGMAELLPQPEGVASTVTMRPYQLQALSWFAWLEANHLGGILADDMGLGKTLTTLSLIAHDHQGPTLVVCPTSLVRNWEREAGKFTPGLRVKVLHGSTRGCVDPDVDVAVTSYGTALRDVKMLRDVTWHRVVFDEAQAVKNNAGATHRAVRSIGATHRHCLTGTPVENHLGELHSIMSIVNPGLLGDAETFRSRYVTSQPVDGDLEALRRVVAPFMLRRKKTDPGVLDELPPKITTRDDCGLTQEQRTLYQAKVASLVDTVEGVDRRQRVAQVIAGLTALKQVCTHPDLYLKGVQHTSHTWGERSGKVKRLTEILTEIQEEGEAAVVFSQYATLLRPLQAHLEAAGVSCLVLDGSMPLVRRTEVVDAFTAENGPTALLVSLRAGGTGLNLTRANHVVHVDRWWNPAVEDQASDRAWRMGQTRTVQVHNLVCPGTLEERIETLLTAKRELADTIVTTTTNLVTDLTDDELKAFVTLDLEGAFE